MNICSFGTHVPSTALQHHTLAHGRQSCIPGPVASSAPGPLARRPSCLRAAAFHSSGTAAGDLHASSFAGQQLRCGALRRPKGGRGNYLVVRADSDYYEILGVPRDADKKAIKSAYRQKARKFHPDVNKDAGAEETFKEISNAYEVLSDDDTRSRYDRFGEAGLKNGMGGFGGAEGFSNPMDIFESFFGASMGGMGGFGARSRGRAKIDGENVGYDLVIDFHEAVFGTSKDVEIARLELCDTCKGSGVKAGTTPVTCGTCGGSGQVVTAVRTPLGAFQQVSICPECEGSGETSTPCGTCGGDGRVRRTKRINIRVPAGVDTGSRLRVKGEGNAGRRGGEDGSLFVDLRVRDHPQLRREGTTIHSDVEVNYVDAILGTSVQVLTVDGMVDLKIPAGTQPGTTLVMAKRGVPRLGSSANVRGDHMVHVKVTIPRKVQGEERRLVEELKELSSKKPARGIFG
eukprot:jgi/Botrbrau1/4693/Bobra.0218s0015.1